MDIQTDMALPIDEVLHHWDYILTNIHIGLTDAENVLEVYIDARGTDELSQIHIHFYVNTRTGTYSIYDGEEEIRPCDRTELWQ